MNPANMLTQALQKSKGLPDKGIVLHALSGDASTRRYFRVQSGEQTAILQLTEAFQAKNEFLLNQEFLAVCGIAVPKILAILPEEGAVLQEDLGDRTLLAELLEQGPAVYEKKAFTDAIGLLAQFHEKAKIENYRAEAPAGFKLAFDEEKLLWEVNFTLEHFYGAHLSRPFEGGERNLVWNDFTKICTALAAEPRVYTHRDYHTRNLMVDPRRGLVAIDFQDARMGLRQYDLASILRDSYYQLDQAKIYAFLDFYWEQCASLGAKAPKTNAEREHFIKIFDWMSVQRNFKALGTFGFQASTRKNPYYLRFVGNTFQNIRRTLMKYPEFSELARALSLHFYG